MCSRYRIRLPTDKEQEMKVSKAVKKMRFYESTLLAAYKVYGSNSHIINDCTSEFIL